MLVKQSELQEARESLRAIERERDEWRAKEEQLRDDLYFLKEINVKSHEITKAECEKRIHELQQEHCKTLELLSKAQSQEEDHSLEIHKKIEEKSRLETEVKILEMANLGLEQRATFAESESLKLQSELGKLEEKCESLQGKNRSLEQAKHTCESQNRLLKEEIRLTQSDREKL